MYSLNKNQIKQTLEKNRTKKHTLLTEEQLLHHLCQSNLKPHNYRIILETKLIIFQSKLNKNLVKFPNKKSIKKFSKENNHPH